MTFLADLESKQSIVDPQTGRPSLYFLRYLRDRRGALSDLEAAIIGRRIIAGAGLTGGGVISDGDITLSADVQAILDGLGTAQGDILYRGATGWTVLAPGTSGQFLKTNGAGADPAWAATGSGGRWYFSPPLASSLPTLVSPDANLLTLTDDTDVGLLVDPGVVNTNDDLRCAFKSISSPTSDWSVEIGIQSILQGTNYINIGLAIRDSAGGKLHVLGPQTGTSGILGLNCARWTSVNTFSAATLLRNYSLASDVLFLRIRQVSGTYYFDFSHNGKQWHNHTTQTNSVFLGSPADQVGIFALVNNGNADSRSYYNVVRWVQSGL